MHVAPILQGGVGNALFQLAAIHVYAKFEADVPCVVGFFNHVSVPAPYLTRQGEGWHIRRAEKSWKNEPQGYTFPGGACK